MASLQKSSLSLSTLAQFYDFAPFRIDVRERQVFLHPVTGLLKRQLKLSPAAERTQAEWSETQIIATEVGRICSPDRREENREPKVADNSLCCVGCHLRRSTALSQSESPAYYNGDRTCNLSRRAHGKRDSRHRHPDPRRQDRTSRDVD